MNECQKYKLDYGILVVSVPFEDSGILLTVVTSETVRQQSAIIMDSIFSLINMW